MPPRYRPAVSPLCHGCVTPGTVPALCVDPAPSPAHGRVRTGPAPRPSRLPSGRGHGGSRRGPPRHRQRCPAAGAAQGRDRGADQGVLRAAGGGQCPGTAGPGRGAPCGPAGPAASQPLPLPSQQKGVGMHEPLVDAEGFPRADIDVYQVRTARHNIICERGTGTGRGTGAGALPGPGRAPVPRDEPAEPGRAGQTRPLPGTGGTAGFCEMPVCCNCSAPERRAALSPVSPRFCSVLGAESGKRFLSSCCCSGAEILALLRSTAMLFCAVCRVKFW